MTSATAQVFTAVGEIKTKRSFKIPHQSANTNIDRTQSQVVLSYDQDRLLAPSKKKQVESALRLDQPLRLDRLGMMLGVIRVEFAD